MLNMFQETGGMISVIHGQCWEMDAIYYCKIHTAALRYAWSRGGHCHTPPAAWGGVTATPHLHTNPPHLRRLPKVVTRHSSIFREVALIACWMWEESGSLGMGLLWKQTDLSSHNRSGTKCQIATQSAIHWSSGADGPAGHCKTNFT